MGFDNTFLKLTWSYRDWGSGRFSMRRILISLFEYVGPFATQVGPEIILNVVANNYILASLLVSYAVFIAQFN